MTKRTKWGSLPLSLSLSRIFLEFSPFFCFQQTHLRPSSLPTSCSSHAGTCATKLDPAESRDLHSYNSSIQGGYSCADPPSERLGPGQSARVAVGGCAVAGYHVDQSGQLLPGDAAELVNEFVGPSAESNDVWRATEGQAAHGGHFQLDVGVRLEAEKARLHAFVGTGVDRASSATASDCFLRFFPASDSWLSKCRVQHMENDRARFEPGDPFNVWNRQCVWAIDSIVTSSTHVANMDCSAPQRLNGPRR